MVLNKAKISHSTKNLSYLGFDLVAMCVNDILANGGEPLFFKIILQLQKLKRKYLLILIQVLI